MNTTLALTIYDEALRQTNDHFQGFQDRSLEDLLAEPYKTPSAEDVQAVLDSDDFKELKGDVEAFDVIFAAENASREERAALDGLSIFDSLYPRGDDGESLDFV